MDELIPYDFELPKALIAQEPAHPRDHARLLVYDRQHQSIKDDYFYNLERYLPRRTTLVLNNSRVERARLKFGQVEVFVTKSVNDRVVEAMVWPGKKFKAKKTVELTDGIAAKVLGVMADGQRRLEFSVRLDDARLDPFRQTPFPPYITPNEALADEYQTVYAKPLGSKAAPTAGLHFSSNILRNIRMTHQVVAVTLHVGLGTFAPLKAANLKSVTLHKEWCELDEDTARVLNQATHITAVGTTSVRTLESNVVTQRLKTDDKRLFSARSAETDIFIQPGYQFQAVDALITNFHLPKSSLLMLVGAFMGVANMQRVYRHAIEQKYRFYSFGDAMLIL
jgi:S-adenosylmethionine:tRNA ribosyltransferase-isomerase